MNNIEVTVMLNYLNDAELFVFLWIICTMAACLAGIAYFVLKDIIKYYRKTPAQRATDWVNKRIDMERRYNR